MYFVIKPKKSIWGSVWWEKHPKTEDEKELKDIGHEVEKTWKSTLNETQKSDLKTNASKAEEKYMECNPKSIGLLCSYFKRHPAESTGRVDHRTTYCSPWPTGPAKGRGFRSEASSHADIAKVLVLWPTPLPLAGARFDQLSYSQKWKDFRNAQTDTSCRAVGNSLWLVY